MDLELPGLVPVFRLLGRKSQVPASVQHSRPFILETDRSLMIDVLITPSPPRLLVLFIKSEKKPFKPRLVKYSRYQIVFSILV